MGRTVTPPSKHTTHTMATQAITTDAYKLYPSPHNLHRTVFDLQSFVPYP